MLEITAQLHKPRDNPVSGPKVYTLEEMVHFTRRMKITTGEISGSDAMDCDFFTLVAHHANSAGMEVRAHAMAREVEKLNQITDSDLEPYGIMPDLAVENKPGPELSCAKMFELLVVCKISYFQKCSFIVPALRLCTLASIMRMSSSTSLEHRHSSRTPSPAESQYQCRKS
jgi:hypothetical protein